MNTASFFTLEVIALAVLLLPLASAIITFLISDRYAWTVSILSALLLLVSALGASYLAWAVDGAAFSISIPWFILGDTSLSLTLSLNEVSTLMMATVAVVSFLVHLYSSGYMAADENVKGYFGMLGFFTFAMLGIVVAGNLLVTFVCWEWVGFASYRLISHWQDRPDAASAGKKAFIINRIGDLGFVVGLMIIWNNAGTFDLSALAQMEGEWQGYAALCIFAGVAGKSAQLPLFTWLPDAMAGPTPVSALIHAATMVAAGVYLLFQVHFLFAPPGLTLVLIVGLITSLAGALGALQHYDIKKILAYSTISQLGLMVAAAGAGAPGAAMLHLFTHAFFKACLFLGAGSIIHALHQAQQQSHTQFDVQDIRQLGGLRRKLPLTFVAFVISGCALAGLPLTSGFLSKDAILGSLLAWAQHRGPLGYAALITGFIISFLSVLYTFRLIWHVFHGSEKATAELDVREPPMVMRLPLVLLAAASLWFAFSWNPFHITTGWYAADTNTWLLAGSILWVTLAFIFAWALMRKTPGGGNDWLTENFYLDRMYKVAIVKPVVRLASLTGKADREWIDGFVHALALVQVTIAHIAGWADRVLVDGAVSGVVFLARWTGNMARSFQSGKIQQYVFWAVVGLIIFLFWTLI